MYQLLAASDQKLWIKIELHYYTFTEYTTNLRIKVQVSIVKQPNEIRM